MTINRRQFVFAALANAVVASAYTASKALADTNLEKLKTILASLPARQWANVPGTSMHPVVPPASMIPDGGAATGPSSVLSAWNGAAYDSDTQRLYFWGGGHTDYGGNEVYELDLETLKIGRLTNPSPLTTQPPPGMNASATCRLPGDGTPLSSHDYDGIVWSPVTKTVWLWPFVGYCGQGSVITAGQCWEFDQSKKAWHRGPDVPKSPVGFGIANACWVPKHKKILLQSNGSACWFDPAARVYSGWSSDFGSFGESISCYVSHRDEVWICWNGILKVALKEPVPGRPESVIGPNNKPSGEIYGTSGMLYDPANKAILFWSGGGDIWALNPDTLQWRFLPAAAGSRAPKAHAVLSKWKYVAELSCCVAYTDIDEGLWLWKPGDLTQVATYKKESGFIVQNADGSNPRSFSSATDAASNVRDGQTIRILKNAYGGWREGMAIKANNVTITGDPGAALYGAVVEGIGLIAGYGNDLKVQNLEIFNVHGDGSASAIRFLGKNLTMRNLHIHDCDMGLLSAGDNGIITVEDVVISECGGSGGQAHNIYVSASDHGTASQFIFRRSQSLQAVGQGHLLKSRSLATTIENSLLAMLDANSSRCIDISDGGTVIVRNSVIQQGPKSDNDDIIGIALELAGEHLAPGWSRHHSTTIENNVVISDVSGPPVGLVHTRSPSPVAVKGNQIVIAGPSGKFSLRYSDPNDRAGISDGGGNKIINGRAAAGFQPFPWVPAAPKA
ncbi:MAG: right-handed parallel beta-helix repeat-containing protein [Candidatus Acidiferrum sp.]